MDALKKLLETAQALQEAALQAELDKIKIQETPVRPRPQRDWSSDNAPAGRAWSSEAPARPGQQWSGQDAAHSAWVDPASVPVNRAAQAAEVAEVPIAERLRDPETLRTFFLLSEAFGPPPGLKDEDDW